ncbi:MAG TPA: hypothetical protein VF376_00880 [Thermoanaerobaculia bacterium]
MAKKRETKRKVKTLTAKAVRAGEAKRVKGGFIRFKPGIQDDEAPKEMLFTPQPPPFKGQ